VPAPRGRSYVFLSLSPKQKIRFFGMIIFAQAYGFTQVHPVSSLVGYAAEMFNIDKSLKKINRVVYKLTDGKQGI